MTAYLVVYGEYLIVERDNLVDDLSIPEMQGIAADICGCPLQWRAEEGSLNDFVAVDDSGKIRATIEITARRRFP